MTTTGLLYGAVGCGRWGLPLLPLASGAVLPAGRSGRLPAALALRRSLGSSTAVGVGCCGLSAIGDTERVEPRYLDRDALPSREPTSEPLAPVEDCELWRRGMAGRAARRLLDDEATKAVPFLRGVPPDDFFFSGLDELALDGPAAEPWLLGPASACAPPSCAEFTAVLPEE